MSELQVYKRGFGTPILFLINDVFSSLNTRIKYIYEDIYERIQRNDEKRIKEENELIEQREKLMRLRRERAKRENERRKLSRNKTLTQRKSLKKRYKKMLQQTKRTLLTPLYKDLFGDSPESSPITVVTKRNDDISSDRSIFKFNESAIKIIEVLITCSEEYKFQFRTPEILMGEYTNLPRVIDPTFFLMNKEFIEEITLYTSNLIYKGNLHTFLKKNHETLVTFDYYKNRRVGRVGFHQDNNGNSEYLTLSYETPTIGPEIIAASIMEGTPKNIRLRIGETIGLDNRLFIHSTPVPTTSVKTDTVPISLSNYSCENFECSNRLSPRSATNILSTPRNYLRGCWESYHYEKHGLFESDSITLSIPKNYDCDKYISDCICVNKVIGELFGYTHALQAGGF